MDYQLYPLGDQAVLVEFGTTINMNIYQSVEQGIKLLDLYQPAWLVEAIPSYSTITLYYKPMYFVNELSSDHSPYDLVCQEIQKLFLHPPEGLTTDRREVEIPVFYGGESGPDLAYVAKYNGLSEQEVIEIHSKQEYIVYMLGFAPGFPYIGGMSEKIATPRKKSPRLSIPSGSVGIAGSQTGVYPIDTPGGWQLIGQTPLSLFDPHKETPTLLQAGDCIRFKPINKSEFIEMEGKRNVDY